MENAFAQRLMNWYQANSRPLPWRETSDPYLIWLSEIILQQTRVEQGLPYYEHFKSRFPTVKHLAEASEAEVMKAWQGLGYYSRARSLHHTSKYIAFECEGVFPDTFSDLLRLKGIGPYTAAAIASIAFGEAVPVVDGNVYRFLSRYLAIDIPVGTPSAHSRFSSIIRNFMPETHAGQFNQALMEFGALQCKPRIPNCGSCIFRTDCAAYRLGKINLYPVKAAKTRVKELFCHFIVLKKDDMRWLSQRDDSGLWKKLWHFPLLESQTELNEADVLKQVLKTFEFTAEQIIYKGNWKTIHLLTHRKIHACFWEFECRISPRKLGIFEMKNHEMENHALPQIMVKYLRHKQENAEN